MAGDLREFRILGVHPVRSKEAKTEELADLLLVEVEVEPTDAEVDWGQVTQPIDGVDQASWQVAYDERLIDSGRGRWAFFLHFVQLDRPLMTPVGPREWPKATPMPVHLASIEYELP